MGGDSEKGSPAERPLDQTAGNDALQAARQIVKREKAASDNWNDNCHAFLAALNVHGGDVARAYIKAAEALEAAAETLDEVSGHFREMGNEWLADDLAHSAKCARAVVAPVGSSAPLDTGSMNTASSSSPPPPPSSKEMGSK